MKHLYQTNLNILYDLSLGIKCFVDMKRVFYHNNWFLPSLKLVEDANIRKCSFLCFDNTHPCMVHSRSKPDGECWILHLRQGNSQWKYTYLKMKDTTSCLQSTLSKNQTKLHLLSTVFQLYFPTHVQEIRQCIQWRVCSGPIRSFLSWLHGPHQFPFPASKFRVLLAIWFGFLIVETR